MNLEIGNGIFSGNICVCIFVACHEGKHHRLIGWRWLFAYDDVG